MVIFQALEFIRLNLDAFIKNQVDSFNTADSLVKLGNISFIADKILSNSTFDEGIYLSLVNIQEESTFKNQQQVRISEVNANYKEPPIYLNLFVLMSPCYSDYSKSMEVLSYIIQYFHTNKTFKFSNKPVSEEVVVGEPDYTFDESLKTNLQLSFDLFSLTFEQLNYLWGTLGGRQIPFVLYKARVLEIGSDLHKKGGGYIEEIQTINPKV